MARHKLTRFIILGMLLTACADYPALGTTPAAARADYPQLVPLTGLLTRASVGQLADPTLSRDLAARALRLRARAAALRRNAVTPQDRDRIRAAVARHAR